jgi:hypothetical protein
MNDINIAEVEINFKTIIEQAVKDYRKEMLSIVKEESSTIRSNCPILETEEQEEDGKISQIENNHEKWGRPTSN